MINPAVEYVGGARLHGDVADQELIDRNGREIRRKLDQIGLNNIDSHSSAYIELARFFIEIRSSITVFKIYQTVVDVETSNVPAFNIDYGQASVCGNP